MPENGEGMLSAFYSAGVCHACGKSIALSQTVSGIFTLSKTQKCKMNLLRSLTAYYPSGQTIK